MANVTKTIYLTKFFNNNANPYGDFDPVTSETVPLSEIVSNPADLHETMRQDETIGAYQTYEVYSCEENGVTMTSEPVNYSIKTIFGSVKSVQDIEIITGWRTEGEIRKPFLEEYPHENPDSVYVDAGGGDISDIYRPDDESIRVIDRKTDTQIWPKPKA